MKAELLEAEVLHGDDTRLQVLREPGKTPQSDSYMWLYRTSGDAVRHVVYYEYKPDHKERHPADFLGGWSGFLHTDGYQGYHKLKNVTVIGCWAHVRRKFADIVKTIPEKARPGSESMRGLQYCDQMFRLEREFVKQKLSFDERFEARLKQSKPVMDAFFDWAKNSSVLPQSGVGEAITYAQNQRFWLEHFLLDGRLEISNNRAERSVKPFTIGRRNWLFADTVGGANASAVLYSVVETAKENGLYPFDYLEFVFRTAPGLDFRNDPAARRSRHDRRELERLLPWNVPPDLRRNETPAKALPWDVI